jgi:hypothetical protein
MEWIAFERIEGTILIHERLDVAAALVAFTTAKVHGAKTVEFKNFLPVWDRQPVSEADVARQLEAIFKEAASQPSPPSS